MTKEEFREKAKEEKWDQAYVDGMVEMLEEAKEKGQPYIPYEFVLKPPKVPDQI